MIPGWLETSFDIFSHSLVWYFHTITHHVVLLRMDNSLGFLLFLFFLIQSLFILFKTDEFFIWSEEKLEYWADESKISRDSPGGPAVRTQALSQLMAWIWFLVSELKSYEPHSVTKKKQINKLKKNNNFMPEKLRRVLWGWFLICKHGEQHVNLVEYGGKIYRWFHVNQEVNFFPKGSSSIFSYIHKIIINFSFN